MPVRGVLRLRPVLARLPGPAMGAVLALALAACVAPGTAVIGDPLPPPPPAAPRIVLQVVGVDGPLAAVEVVAERRAVETTTVPGAVVAAVPARQQATTDARGMVELLWPDPGLAVTVSPAARHLPTTLELVERPDTPVVVELEPVVVSVRVVDPDGAPLAGAWVRADGREAVTGADGLARLEAIDDGPVTVWRPGWTEATVDRDGEERLKVALEPRIVRAIHVTGPAARDEGHWERLMGIVEETEIDGIVLDIKDESGRIFYDTDVALAEEVEAERDWYDPTARIAEAHDRGAWVIGRIVTFQDPVAARARPDLAILSASNGAPFRKGGQYFLDPTDPAARAYGLALAEEACALGFDEIQFDYIRFPDGMGTNVVLDAGRDMLGRYDDPASGAVRVRHIASFLEEAQSLLHPMGCVVAADIFAIVLSTPDDQGIGQRPEDIGAVVDVLSPMVYPDHYSPGSFGYAEPGDHPGAVVAAALDHGIPRVPHGTVLRPWIADYLYSASQVRAEIEAAEARGLGWMLWNANSNVTVGALRPAADPDADADEDAGSKGP